MYQKINKEVDNKIQAIIEGDYDVSILGTLGKEGYPFLSKILPMYNNNKIYILISDLSEHTQNIIFNNKVSFYFSMKEINNTKLNNPRLTLSGSISKLELNKNSSQYIDLLKNYQKIEKGSKMWGMFTDFNFYSLIPKKALYIEGFGEAYQKYY